MPILPRNWEPRGIPVLPGPCLMLALAHNQHQQNSLCRKDESKEPIVEVRTEEERTPNHDGGKHTEPNETTPLTEPEYVGGKGLAPPQQSPTPIASPCPKHVPCLPPLVPSHTLRAGTLEPGLARPTWLGAACPWLSLERRHSWSH